MGVVVTNTCLRKGCGHPRFGTGRGEGHFDGGHGPCKDPGCACDQYWGPFQARVMGSGRERLREAVAV